MRLGTRGSPLALAQARETRARLSAAHGIDSDTIEIVIIRTTGDAIRDRPLSEAGGKGLFTRELDAALRDGDIDFAVHSAKDVPTLLDADILLAGYLPREDVRDALISRGVDSVADLPPGARIGSASLRRQAQLRRIRPDFNISLLRGNVETRLGKVASGTFDATLLAFAGLKRLGHVDRIAALLPVEDFLPACGQGAIALACRAGDAETVEWLSAICDRDTGIALSAERAFLAALDGSCRTPIAGHAQRVGAQLVFKGEVISVDGLQTVAVARTGLQSDAAEIGRDAARDCLARGAAKLIGS
jgi:hydroxymethylbilane synthase